MVFRHGEHEGFFEQKFAVQLIVVQWQCQYAGVEATIGELQQDLFGLFFDLDKRASVVPQSDVRELVTGLMVGSEA